MGLALSLTNTLQLRSHVAAAPQENTQQVSHTENRGGSPTPADGLNQPIRPGTTPPPVRSGMPTRPPLHSGRPTAQFRTQSTPVPPQAKPVIPSADAAARATALVRNKKRKQRRITQFIILLVVVLLIGAGVLAATVVGPTVVAILGAGKDIFKPHISERIVGPGGTPVAAPTPDWANKQAINILLIGLDYRPKEEDTRADTQIVVHLDLANKTAALISIPRDLWVTIPGFGEGRINAAYQLGDRHTDTVPGGGPTLAMSTVQQNFGIRIDYFAQVDFVGFERVLDALGGVTIDVSKPLIDNEYPLVNYGATRIYIPAGLQHMDGHTALEYARSRHADNDIGRNSRQQQVLLALKQQGLNLNILSHLTDVVNQLAGAVKTDLTFLQLTSLAQLARDIGPQSIQTVILDLPLVNPTVLASGADVLMPNWDLIRPKVAQVFGDAKLSKEAARISVLNGTGIAGVARKVTDELSSKGFAVVNLASTTDVGKHPVTTITDYSGGTKPYTVESLVKALDLTAASVVEGNPADAPLAQADGKPIEIVVVAGDDKAK